MCCKLLLLQLWWSLILKEKWEAWCLVFNWTVKVSKNVSDTHLMNLDSFIMEYSPKLLFLLLEFEISCDWLKLYVTFKKLERSRNLLPITPLLPEIVNFLTPKQSWGVSHWKILLDRDVLWLTWFKLETSSPNWIYIFIFQFYFSISGSL